MRYLLLFLPFLSFGQDFCVMPEQTYELPDIRHQRTAAQDITIRLHVNVINYKPNATAVNITEAMIRTRFELVNLRLRDGFIDSRFAFVPTNIQFRIVGVTVCNDCYHKENGVQVTYKGKAGSSAFHYYTTGQVTEVVNNTLVESKGVAPTPDAMNFYIRQDFGFGIAGQAYLPNSYAQFQNNWFGWAWSRDVPEVAGFGISAVIEHELFHMLGLRHTFQGGCTGVGDGVADTPPSDSPVWSSFGDFFRCNNLVQNTNLMDYGGSWGLTFGQLSLSNASISQWLMQWVDSIAPPVSNFCDLKPYQLFPTVNFSGSVGALSVDALSNASRVLFTGQGSIQFDSGTDTICELDLRFGWLNGSVWSNPVRNIRISVGAWDTAIINSRTELVVEIERTGVCKVDFLDNDFNRVRYFSVSSKQGSAPVSVCDTTYKLASMSQGWSSSTFFPCFVGQYLHNNRLPLRYTLNVGLQGEYSLYVNSRGSGRASDVRVEVGGQVFMWNQNLSNCTEIYLGRVVNPDSIVFISGSTSRHTILDEVRLSCEPAPMALPVRVYTPEMHLERKGWWWD